MLDSLLLKITPFRRDDAVVLRVAGELDMGRAPSLAVEAAAVIRARDSLVVDLTGVTFMDSTGAAMLLNACRRATRAGVGFAVVCPAGAARRTLELARLTETLKVADSEAEARRRMHSFLPAA